MCVMFMIWFNNEFIQNFDIKRVKQLKCLNTYKMRFNVFDFPIINN